MHLRRREDGRLARGRCVPRTDAEVRGLLRLLPRYRVLLHATDAPVGPALGALLRCVPPLGAEQARRILSEARRGGTAQVIVCLREEAEHYATELGACALPASIELT